MTFQEGESSSFQSHAGEASDGEAAAAGALRSGSLYWQALVPACVACLGAMGSLAYLVSPSPCKQAGAGMSGAWSKSVLCQYWLHKPKLSASRRAVYVS